MESETYKELLRNKKRVCVVQHLSNGYFVQEEHISAGHWFIIRRPAFIFRPERYENSYFNEKFCWVTLVQIHTSGSKRQKNGLKKK